MEENRGGYKILVADDDPNVHQSLNAYFRREGYQMISAYDGDQAVQCARVHRPDMIILNVPIIMLTAKGDEFDKLLGLEMGADDYITKPFSPREVLARVKAVLRRMHEMREDDKASHLVIANLEIDMNAFTVKLDGKLIPCTPKETEILWTLASNPGMVFSREHMLQSIWGYDFLGDTRAVDSHIKRIRAQLCAEDNGWDIKTVWGVGYRFEVAGSEQA